jgi:hypothetical protein
MTGRRLPCRSRHRSTRNAERGTRSLSLLLALLFALSNPLSAQQGADSLLRRSSPFVVKYGKWALVAASIGMGLKAASDHRAADRAFERLDRYCSDRPDGCPQLPSGRYIDPAAERHYQTSLRHDRSARGWLLGGEATILGAAGLFVWELTRPKSLPRNIPFEPEIRWTGLETTVGGKVRF